MGTLARNGLSKKSTHRQPPQKEQRSTLLNQKVITKSHFLEDIFLEGTSNFDVYRKVMQISVLLRSSLWTDFFFFVKSFGIFSWRILRILSFSSCCSKATSINIVKSIFDLWFCCWKQLVNIDSGTQYFKRIRLIP